MNTRCKEQGAGWVVGWFGGYYGGWFGYYDCRWVVGGELNLLNHFVAGD